MLMSIFQFEISNSTLFNQCSTYNLYYWTHTMYSIGTNRLMTQLIKRIWVWSYIQSNTNLTVQCIRTSTLTCPDEKSKCLKSDSTTSTPRWDALVLTTAMDWGWQRLSTRNSGVSVHLHCLCVLGKREVQGKLQNGHRKVRCWEECV